MLNILKSTTLIVIPRYPYRKHIKTNYKTQFLTDLVVNNEIKKTKTQKITRINLRYPSSF